MKAFETAAIGELMLPNRLLMAPVKTGLGTPDGIVTDRQIAYYRRRAEGGVGAIIVEPLYVDSAGKEHPRQLGIDSADKVEGLRRLAGAIHAGGARAIAHLNHAGRAANPKASGRKPEAPSESTCASTGAVAGAMEAARIAEIVQAFAGGAARALESGFDAVELQCGLGYLIAQFLSARTNRRTDRYGGDEAGRERFANEVVRAIHEALGRRRIPLIARVSAVENVDGGLTLEDAGRLCARLESWGAGAIHVVTGSACDTPPLYYQHMSLPEGTNEKLAAKLGQTTSLPVIVAGRLGNPQRIEELLASEQVDFIALGRPLVADPDLPRKIREGKADEVVACGSCLQGCLASVKAGRGIACIVNPEAGREAEVEHPAESPRSVVIVGGGPAGLTSAIVASRRGHRVTLFERAELGGQFALAPLAPGKAAMARPFRALVDAARRSGAEIRTGAEATPEQIAEFAPDVVVLATGSSPLKLEVPGLDAAFTGNDVLAGKVEPGERVLVIGGGLVGIETAEFLGRAGKNVVVVEILEEIARDMEMITRKLTLKRLAELPVEIHTGTRIERFDQGMATVVRQGKSERIGPFDSVVVAVGVRRNYELAEPLVALGIEVHLVGDALEPRQVLGAVQTAWQAAREL